MAGMHDGVSVVWLLQTQAAGLSIEGFGSWDEFVGNVLYRACSREDNPESKLDQIVESVRANLKEDLLEHDSEEYEG